MPKSTNQENDTRPSGGERVFADDQGRLWTAISTVERDGRTVIFTCITEGRQSGRAIVIDLSQEVGDVGDETLRAWLAAAPRIGRLT